ncbi:MAG TPA: NAD(+)/NADH kinase [Solirubrobacteraceae bacterium]|nr:NAD(+)/NADH kinase [Solirubrobacteraceae bacterium]
MATSQHQVPGSRPSPASLSRIGLVVHPTRPVDGALVELREWAQRSGVDVVQVRAFCRQKQVAEQGEPADCGLIVAIGGDGTTLAAIHAGIQAGRPVLGVACGSLGVLTSVSPSDMQRALERFTAGDWTPRSLPALDGVREHGEPVLAVNDIVVVRAGEGQIRVRVLVDGTLYARVAGDGCVISTPLGSSAYGLSAGGPLLAAGTNAFAFTPLYAHGGVCPPLVVSGQSELQIVTTPGYGGARLEVDGQPIDPQVGELSVTLRSAVATVVGFDDSEQFLTGLRRRKIIADSPRFLAEDARGWG